MVPTIVALQVRVEKLEKALVNVAVLAAAAERPTRYKKKHFSRIRQAQVELQDWIDEVRK